MEVDLERFLRHAAPVLGGFYLAACALNLGPRLWPGAGDAAAVRRYGLL